MNKRDELLIVAAQLASGMNAHGCSDNGALANYNTQAVIAAKDLISKIDAEFEDAPQSDDSKKDAIDYFLPVKKREVGDD